MVELERGDPEHVAVQNALTKARAALRDGAGEVVLGCDTIVVLDGTIYGKPSDTTIARATISALAGRTHEVLSGLALLLPSEGSGIEERTALARSLVTFRELDDEQIERYVATEEWRGRSGGYAIQGEGARIALSVQGEEENVVGLPLRTLLELYPEIV